FGAALAARPGEHLPENSEIAVQTRVSAACSHLYKSHMLTDASLESVVPEVSIPPLAEYSRRGLLEPFFGESSISETRREYLYMRARYRAGSASPRDMAESRDEYQRKLNEYFFPFVKTHITNIAGSAGIGWLADWHGGAAVGGFVAVFVLIASELGREFVIP